MLRTRSVGAALILDTAHSFPPCSPRRLRRPTHSIVTWRRCCRRLGSPARFISSTQARIEANLGRPIDARLAEIGRLLWFDTIHSLHADNTCGGCHSPTNGFGDSQPMAIGVQNNGIVGPHRTGPRNQRRSPLVINTALYPALMWNGRFSSLSGDPFDNSHGFRFPFPEDDERFSHANDVGHGVTHLLQAQAHMPPTELIEVGGLHRNLPGRHPGRDAGAAFCQFDDGLGESVPLPDPLTGSRNEPIRQKALDLLNATPATASCSERCSPKSRRARRSTSSCSARRSPNSSSRSCSRMRPSTSSRAATRQR